MGILITIKYNNSVPCFRAKTRYIKVNYGKFLFYVELRSYLEIFVISYALIMFFLLRQERNSIE